MKKKFGSQKFPDDEQQPYIYKSIRNHGIPLPDGRIRPIHTEIESHILTEHGGQSQELKLYHLTDINEVILSDEDAKKIGPCENVIKQNKNLVVHGVVGFLETCVQCGCRACRFCRRLLNANFNTHPDMLIATKILPRAIMNEVLSQEDSVMWLCLNCIDGIQFNHDRIVKKAKWKKRLIGLGLLSTASLRRDES